MPQNVVVARKFVAIVPAAGLGTRLGDARPKQYLDLGGRPMIHHALSALARVRRISRIFAVLSPGDQYWPTFDWSGLAGRVEVLHCGGAKRGETVLNALNHLTDALAPEDWVLVHDAARPCLGTELVEQFLDELENDPVGGLLALPVADTLKEGDSSQRVTRTVSREGLWRAQTPQMFRYGVLRTAMTRMTAATDEAQAVEALGHAARLVVGDSVNLKVTYASDLKLADILLKRA
jgi:2-C-methyl-D-erythritol 4-phosphate cytidylyltransferase